MNDKYLSEGFESYIPTRPTIKATASRIVLLPKGLLIFLIALLACVSSYVCSKTFAEDQAMTNLKIDQADKMVQEMGIADQPRRKKVLVLNSYHPGYMWSDDLVAGILSVLDDGGGIEVLIEYIDSKRYTGKEYFDRIEEIVRYKHRKEKIDVIIASDHHAVELILRMRSTFHRGIPLVFCGIDDFNWEHRAEYEPIYGLEEKDGGVLGTLDLVFSVHPRLRAVYFVADETKSAQVMLKYVRQAEASQKEGVKFNYLVGMSIAEVETAVREVPADSVVMWLHFVRDKNGRVLPTTESQQWLAEHSPVPVYCPWGFKAGTGVLGGRILSGFTQGKKVAEITLRVIDKQDPQPIPYGQQAPLTTEFDYEVMHRFGIGMDDIPIGSIVHRRPLSAMEKYKWWIISGVGVLIIEALLITFLLINIRKRKSAKRQLKGEIARHKATEKSLREQEAKLKDSEKTFRSIIEQSPLAIAIFTPEGQITHVNSAWKRQWGVNDEETAQVLEKYNFLTDKEAEAHGVMPLIKKAFAGESVILPPMEYVSKNTLNDIGLDQINPNTVWIQCHVTPVKNENHEIEYVLITNMDITKRKMDEEKLIQAEKRYRTVADFTYDWEYWKNPDGTFLYVSPSCERITGYKPEEFINNPEFFRELILPEDKTRWDEHHQKALKEKVLQEIQFRIHKQDGQTRWIEHVCRPVTDEKGEFLGFRASNRDITQRKKIEEEANRLREEYLHVARVVAIGELAASLAHELKQPLAAIRSNAQAAQRFLTGEKPDLDEFHEILTDIIKDNRRADEVISRLKTLMLKGNLQVAELNINELIREIFPLIHSYEMMRNISLGFEPDDKLPSVAADRVQIQQVVLNLLLNSSEALMGVSGDMRKITVQTSQKDTHNITVAIKDNGPGIDEQNIDHLFEPFYTTKKEGLGMGLAISKSIVEVHRGSLWAENNSERGVTFYFTIPVFKRSSA